MISQPHSPFISRLLVYLSLFTVLTTAAKNDPIITKLKDLEMTNWQRDGRNDGYGVAGKKIVKQTEVLRDSQVAEFARDGYYEMLQGWAENIGKASYQELSASQRNKIPSMFTAVYFPLYGEVWIGSSIKGNRDGLYRPITPDERFNPELTSAIIRCQAWVESMTDEEYAGIGEHRTKGNCAEPHVIGRFLDAHKDVKLPFKSTERVVSIAYGSVGYDKQAKTPIMGFENACGRDPKNPDDRSWGCAGFMAWMNVRTPDIGQFKNLKRHAALESNTGENNRSKAPLVWTYDFSSAEKQKRDVSSATTTAAVSSPGVVNSAAAYTTDPAQLSSAEAVLNSLPAVTNTADYYGILDFKDEITEKTDPDVFKVPEGEFEVSEGTCVQVFQAISSQEAGTLSYNPNINKTLADQIMNAIAPNGTMPYNGSNSLVSIEWNTWNSGRCWCQKQDSSDDALHGICCDKNAKFLYQDLPTFGDYSSLGNIPWNTTSFLLDFAQDYGFYC